MASPASVTHIVSEAYLFYRKTPVGASLFYALAKLVGDGDLPRRAAYGVLEQFDHAVLKAVRRPADQWGIHFELCPGRLSWYRYCNGMWWFRLSHVRVYRNFPVRQVARFLRERHSAGELKRKSRGDKFRSKSDFIAVPVETVAAVTVTAYTPFTQGRKFGPRTHFVDGWLCHVHEWEENLNPKITVFRYEKVGRKPKKRDDDGAQSQDANKKKEPSFDPRSAAAGLLVAAPAKSRAEIAKEKEARYLEKRARERREAAARRKPAKRAQPATTKANDSHTSEEELLRALPHIAVQPMPWQSKSGVSSSGVRHSRPARLTGPPPKKPESIEE